MKLDRRRKRRPKPRPKPRLSRARIFSSPPGGGRISPISISTAAGIRHERHGIVVDRRLRTTNKHVYAIGDVIDAPKSTHVAQHHAGLVIRHALFRTPVDADSYAVPFVTFTDPELAQVGLTEDEARGAG